MRCYYEELGVARDANESEIKSSYRKLALRWHPDKNLNSLEEAKEQFLLIQQAYEVLSDPHERAWYDNHREQIIRGKNSNYEENCLDVFQYFTSTCFKGYGDDEKGFYKVYADVFEKIATEDSEFMDDEEDILSIPKFGNSTSSYEEVVGPFYAYWQSYCTKKTYTWLCPYDITEIKDRRILREIEKDLKKVVQKAKRERNDEVRNLVSFIRKRDRRVQAHKKLLEERAALNREKQERNRIEQIRKRNREMEEMRQSNGHTFSDGYEEQLKQLEQEYGIDDSEEENGDEFENLNEATTALDLEDDIVGDLYCVACNRAFKNQNAFLNHETSKKHRENLELLRCQMQEEEEIFGAEESDAAENEIVISSVEESNDAVDNVEIEISSSSQNKRKKKKKAKKSNKTNSIESDEDEEKVPTDPPLSTDAAADEWDETSKKSSKKSKNKKSKKVGDQKIIKDSPEPKKEIIVPIAPNADPTVHACATCNSVFESKNKLFAHLKKTNHSVFLSKPKLSKAAANSLETPEPTKSSKGKRK